MLRDTPLCSGSASAQPQGTDVTTGPVATTDDDVRTARPFLLVGHYLDMARPTSRGPGNCHISTNLSPPTFLCDMRTHFFPMERKCGLCEGGHGRPELQ